MKIIIVHEEITIRKKLRQCIELEGHKVIGESVNGIQAYNNYLALEPDVIFLNIDMPIYNGQETLEKILAYNSKAFCVILSQNGDNKRVFDLLESGAKHFLNIPFDRHKVSRLLDDISKIRIEMEL